MRAKIIRLTETTTAEFSDLPNVIQQWVFRYFRSGLDRPLKNHDLLLQAFFKTPIPKNEPLEDFKAKLDAVSAIVTTYLLLISSSFRGWRP